MFPIAVVLFLFAMIQIRWSVKCRDPNTALRFGASASALALAAILLAASSTMK